MAVSHIYSSPVADATGTQTIWLGSSTVTVAASDLILPSHWNSAHNQVVTLGGNTAGVSTISGTNIVFGGSNNITLSGIQGANAATINISAAAGGGGGSMSVSAGASSAALDSIVYSNSNGVSFGLNGSTITATVRTDYQSAGAYLTTARASNDAIGLATAQSNVTWTANSDGLSLDARGYAGTGTTIGATNLSASATLNSNGLQLSLSAAAGGGGADGGNTIIAGTRTAGSNSGVLFDNSNGVTFGLNAVGGTVITASVRTDYASSAHAHTENVGTATAQSNVTWTVNSNGISLNANGYAGTGFTSTTTAGTAIVATNATNGLSLAFPTIVTNALTSQSNQNITAANGGFAFQTLSFSNLNGISFGTSAGSAITASHNAITTGRASTDGIGLNTAQSNVTWTVNSSGLSLDARGYAGTGTTFNGANLSGSMTVNSNGVQLSMSAAAPGGGGLTQGTFFAQSNTTQSSSGTIALSSLNFAGAGIASVGVSNGSVVISVPSGGGAGDGGNTLAAGTRTAGSNSVVLFSNSNGVSFGLNAVDGSVMTASIDGVRTIGGWEPIQANNNSTFSSQGQNSIYLQKMIPDENYSFNNFELRVSGSFVSSTNSQVVAHSISYGLYSLETNNSYISLATSLMVISASYNSNTAMGYTVSQGAASFTTSSGGTAIASLMSGFKHLYLPFTSTITQGGRYAFAMNISSATTIGTSPMRMAVLNQTVINNLTVGKIHATTLLASNASHVGDYNQGVYSATSGGLPASIAVTGLTNAVSQARLYVQLEA